MLLNCVALAWVIPSLCGQPEVQVSTHQDGCWDLITQTTIGDVASDSDIPLWIQIRPGPHINNHPLSWHPLTHNSFTMNQTCFSHLSVSIHWFVCSHNININHLKVICTLLSIQMGQTIPYAAHWLSQPLLTPLVLFLSLAWTQIPSSNTSVNSDLKQHNLFFPNTNEVHVDLHKEQENEIQSQVVGRDTFRSDFNARSEQMDLMLPTCDWISCGCKHQVWTGPKRCACCWAYPHRFKCGGQNSRDTNETIQMDHTVESITLLYCFKKKTTH